ncbi:CobW/P47K family protein [Gemella bergeri ATCC 700627]|uniref:CobW/P47K family protein n=1 Tax=Gemella bergeri ATCC 700627 TaxID=1321820 RepID=U2QL08_9BACL|nr:GTP-binding protein [Gemella bergeri]ERK56904.1 CobW/P47K family protein [Gemella bergeri ATCC 700627]
MTNKTDLILVGGFLGAGKTSLLWEIAKRLNKKGKKVGLITNDQASELVDTSFLETNNDIVEEVSGSCFCCNFGGFADAIAHLQEANNSDIILAESVGSCTDLSATIMQPLKEKYSNSVNLKQLTALADPVRLKAVLKDHSNSGDYIIYKQFEEADVILINKIELLSEDELNDLVEKTKKEFNNENVLTASVKTGEGLDVWFDYIINSKKEVGRRIVEVDYDTYADGEALFGWLNGTYSIEKEENFDELAKNFLANLGERFDSLNLNVGHVKFLLQGANEGIVGNIVGKKETGSLRTLDRQSDKIFLTVNARVEVHPDKLVEIIKEEVDRVFAKVGYKQEKLNALIPGRPNPTFRYREIVKL